MLIATGMPVARAAIHITVLPSSVLEVTEAGGSDTFTVVLDEQPSDDVTIPVSSSDETEATVSTAFLIFTDANWSTAQTVTVTGVDDDVVDGDSVVSILLDAAIGGGYDSVDPDDVAVLNADNDAVGVTVTPTVGLVTWESGVPDTFTVVLNSEPTASVLIGVSSSDPTEGTVSPASLTFTTGNWATPQTVTVTGVDDSIEDGNVIYNVILAMAIGGGYNAVDPANVTVTNIDTDATGGGSIMPTPTNLVDTSASCPDSIGNAGFGDLSGFDAQTVQAIDCIFSYGISNGTSSTLFSPVGTVSRWQMALFLIRQAQVQGLVMPTPTDHGFTDIAGFNQSTRDAINQLAQLGITEGTSSATFSPSNAISRWEMALFLIRFSSVVGITIPDSPASAGFTDLASYNAEVQIAVNRLVELGIAAGTSTTTYEPSSNVLRWQMALFLTRTLAVGGIVPN
jgi:hypothetical protein